MNTSVSFETAKLLKEMGFDKNTNEFYTTAGKLTGVMYYDPTPNNKTIDTEWFSVLEKESTAYCTAPTQSLLQKWLREVHNITVWVEPYTNGSSKCTFIWNRGILNNIWILDTFSMKKHNTYEEALEAGLLEALKLIKT